MRTPPIRSPCRLSFFFIILSGFQWHLSWLPELSLQQLVLGLLAHEPSCLNRLTCYVSWAMFLSRTSMLSSAIYRKHNNTAQRRTSQRNRPCTKHKESTCRSRRDDTRKQANRVGESQNVDEHFYSSLCSQNEQRNRNPSDLQILWCDALIIVVNLQL